VEIIIFYIPCGSSEEAARLGKLAVEQKLAACANVFPIQSVFPWNGSIQSEGEYVCILKTLPYRKAELEEYMTALHAYHIPCIARWTAEVNASYGLWMEEQIGKA
jgi:periplasmic divalent cation tolerance protein